MTENKKGKVGGTTVVSVRLDDDTALAVRVAVTGSVNGRTTKAQINAAVSKLVQEALAARQRAGRS